MSLVTAVVVFMGSLLWLHRFLRAAVVRSDGLQTGIASLQGIFTSISVPGFQLVYPAGGLFAHTPQW
jgi:hypothetical protein